MACSRLQVREERLAAGLTNSACLDGQQYAFQAILHRRTNRLSVAMLPVFWGVIWMAVAITGGCVSRLLTAHALPFRTRKMCRAVMYPKVQAGPRVAPGPG